MLSIKCYELLKSSTQRQKLVTDVANINTLRTFHTYNPCREIFRRTLPAVKKLFQALLVLIIDAFFAE
jgi:hypothetical protein